MDSLIYTLVSRGTVILAEYTNVSGNFTTVANRILTKIDPNEESKLTFVYESYAFHYISSDGLIYMTMADQNFKRRIAFAFLEDIKQRFLNSYGERGKTALSYGMNSDFSPLLKQRMIYYSTNKNADKLTKVQSEVDKVKDVMVQNIEKVIDRGEKLDILVDKAENFNEQAFQFKRSSKKLKWRMFYKNLKLMIILSIVLLLIIYFIIAGICGGVNLKPRCIKKK
ncbi:vesicle-associated membrane protein [Anaeramoeba flamelloides]|uniref:Vesicle-associated membrane protein n=1 Tax=Anaeramoeba flamelloides TaxID=1746091 RepID=A0ABQ8Y9T5_9EUKA|nr:vesicle-associated membrane protein [Anaeramoeba flamelloides]